MPQQQRHHRQADCMAVCFPVINIHNGEKNMATIKQWFEQANGKTVKKEIYGVACAEDWPEISAQYKKELSSKGIQFEETDYGIEFGNQYIVKPKLKKETTGVITVRSKDYIINDVYGDKKGSSIIDGNLVKQYDNGMVVTISIL